MNSDLDKSELKAIRAKAWEVLENTVLKNDSTYAFIKSIDALLDKPIQATYMPVLKVEQIKHRHPEPVFAGGGRSLPFVPATAANIEQFSVEFFKTHGNLPVDAATIVEALAGSGVDIPTEGTSGKISVGRVLSTRPEKFERVEPSSKRFSLKWKLKE